MASVTTTTFDPALKQIYKPQVVEDMTYIHHPIFAILKKFEGFGGRNLPIVLKYGNPQGRSATFATAQTNATSILLDDFLLTRVKDYSIATIDGEVAEASEGSNEAFLKAMAEQIDGAMQTLSDAIEMFLPLSGTGSIGQVSSGSTVSADVITLEDINQVVNFEVGQVLRGTSTDGGAYDTGQEVLEGVNRSTGVLTATSAAWNTVMTSLVASDYLVVSGDGANASTNIKISGFEAWLPASAPGGSDSFFGVNRSNDSRKFGQVHDGSSGTLEEAAIDAQSKVARENGRPDCFLINNAQYRRFVKELGSKVNYDKMSAQGAKGASASVGFRTIIVEGDMGPIQVLAANRIQSLVGWMLEKGSWSLNTLGKATKFLMLDGNRILRQAAADGYEVRLGFRGNLACDAPGHNARVTMPAL